MIYASAICAILTFIMGALHLSLLLGAPLAEYVLGGKEKVVPLKKRWVNALFFLLFLFLGYLYLGNANVTGRLLPGLATKIIMGLYTAFLTYAIFANLFLTESKKEKYVMTPASIIGSVTSLLTILFT